MDWIYLLRIGTFEGTKLLEVIRLDSHMIMKCFQTMYSYVGERTGDVTQIFIGSHKACCSGLKLCNVIVEFAIPMKAAFLMRVCRSHYLRGKP
jgi:hypothetical protein